jgi:HEAT repeat protein
MSPDAPAAAERRHAVGRQALAASLAELAVGLSTASSAKWRRFDRSMRDRSFWTEPQGLTGWSTIQPFEVELLAQASGDAAGVAAILSTHSNGHVREAAVNVMVELRSPIPALLLRSADWVDPVRFKAQSAVWAVAESEGGPLALAHWLPLLNPTDLAVRQREFFATIYLSTVERLSTDDILDLFEAIDPHVRQAAARSLIVRGETLSALPRALAARDPLLARMIVSALSGVEVAQPGVLDALLSSDRLDAHVRAFLHLRAAQPDRAEAVAHDFLVQRSAIVRFLGQRFLDERGFDVAELYRKGLPTNEVALAGLGEVGVAADAERVAPYLGSPTPRVRAAAVLAYAKLADRAALPRLIAALQDPSSRVAKAASRALVRLGISEEVVEAAWAATVSRPSSRSATFRIFSNAGRWTHLEIALRAVRSADAALVDFGMLLFDVCMWTWNRSTTSASTSSITGIWTALADAKSALGSRRYDLAAVSVKPWLPRNAERTR